MSIYPAIATNGGERNGFIVVLLLLGVPYISANNTASHATPNTDIHNYSTDLRIISEAPSIFVYLV